MLSLFQFLSPFWSFFLFLHYSLHHFFCSLPHFVRFRSSVDISSHPFWTVVLIDASSIATNQVYRNIEVKTFRIEDNSLSQRPNTATYLYCCCQCCRRRRRRCLRQHCCCHHYIYAVPSHTPDETKILSAARKVSLVINIIPSVWRMSFAWRTEVNESGNTVTTT